MYRIGMAAAALTLAASAALAQPGGGGADQPPPLSVWRIDSGAAEHLQSGLACPAQVGSYRRTQLHVYDRFGLDVSCNYLDPALSDVTVYLTRRSGSTAADAMAEAKREFLEVRAAMHPQPISETRPAIGGVAWDLALYNVDGGMRDAIWIADLDGWTLEYRVTYRADGEARVATDMAAFIDGATGSAGTRLGLCAKAPPPERRGVAAPVDEHTAADAPASAIASAVAARKAAAGPSPRPVLWCQEETGSAGGKDVVFWRGVYEDGSDAGADRVTAMTVDDPVALVATSAQTLEEIDRKLDRPIRWQATVADAAGGSRLYGFFTARPTSEALGSLYMAILSGRAHPLSGYAVKGHAVTILGPGG